MMQDTFAFKQFYIRHARSAMKVGTDGVLLGAWADVEGMQHALDIGAGSGLIAIMLAQRAAAAHIDAVEIDEAAADEAAENMASSPFGDRLRCFPLPIQDFVPPPPMGQYDLVVSNPPFFSGGVLSFNESRKVVRHTVKLPHNELLLAVQRLLAPQGRFCLILPLLEGLRFEELALQYGLYVNRRCSVHPREGQPVNRLLLQFTLRRPAAITEEKLAIYQAESQSWTHAYCELTRDFYLSL
jgi:tRNA1Val (adenine37-N6)-methyltransferase